MLLNIHIFGNEQISGSANPAFFGFRLRDFFFLIQTSDLSVSQVMTNSEVSSHRLVYIHKMSSLCLLGKSLTSVFCFCLFVCFLPGDRRPCPGSWDLCRS